MRFTLITLLLLGITPVPQALNQQGADEQRFARTQSRPGHKTRHPQITQIQSV